MKIRDVMTKDVSVASPNDSIQKAAARMAELDIGVLPVGENDKLVGMITDRDIAVRGVARSCDPASTKVSDLMSAEVKYCFEDESVEHIADNMAEQQIRRLPVVNRDKRLVGIVSLADLATHLKSKAPAYALRGISQPGGSHSQSGNGHAVPAMGL
ncbi:MAG TPA: CBS domain-containing protein [Alphaproteobacteria bacterium]|nr:CBS domain-containing protein [Alphaproteobacteria bacterium]